MVVVNARILDAGLNEVPFSQEFQVLPTLTDWSAF